MIKASEVTGLPNPDAWVYEQPFGNQPYSARRCTDGRSAIIQSWGIGQNNRRATLVAARATGKPDNDAHQSAYLQQLALSEAELYWVAPEMCELLDHASTSIPLETSLLAELLPTRNALIFFAKSVDGTTPAPLAAMSWFFSTAEQDEIMITKYTFITGADMTVYQPGTSAVVRSAGFVCASSSPWTIGTTIDDLTFMPITDHGRTTTRDCRSLLLTFCALLASPGIATVSMEKPDNMARKRSIRAGIDPSDTRVIYLRSPQRDAGEPSDPDSDRCHHRWIVSGHWRSQPYGPGRIHRKPVWIAPHVKGPDGAPLLDGDKVRAVVK